MQDHDNQWLEGLRGQKGDGPARAEGLALRDALNAPLPPATPPLSWDELKATASRTPVRNHSAPAPGWLHGVGGLLVGNRLAAVAALAGALALTAGLWPRPAPQPAPPTMRGAAPQAGEAIWRSNAPDELASQWLQRWRKDGIAVSRADAGGCVELRLSIQPGQEAVLLAAELTPDAEGNARVRICPSQ